MNIFIEFDYDKNTDCLYFQIKDHEPVFVCTQEALMQYPSIEIYKLNLLLNEAWNKHIADTFQNLLLGSK